MNARHRLRVDGVVQGVGFRPFVLNLARREGLGGFVSNTSDGVIIEIEGPIAALRSFEVGLRANAPPLAEILSIERDEVSPHGDRGFAIEASRDTPGTRTLVPPDVATCADCRAEITDRANRRQGYPFTNCTNCGPRWTIIDRVPYDRPFTSMARFTMCKTCQREYDDAEDRRFHAQPNACPVCGPRVWIESDAGQSDEDPIVAGASLLAAGRILAIKGLGGFHLAVRADRDQAVRRLRERKRRPAKPLAVMVADVDVGRNLACISADEAVLMSGPRAPIVLLERRAGSPLAPAVAPGQHRIGVMLAYTPLHHLLMAALRRHGVEVAVMTSGNVSDEPICLENDAARRDLAGIADAWLLHDRDILRRADDSVVQVIEGEPVFLRRSRGWAPLPISVPTAIGREVLAAGADLKNAVGLLKDGRVFLSPYVGDLADPRTFDFFETTVATLQTLLECEPTIVAHDRHPGYFSTMWACRDRGSRRVAVQHHHAHLVSVQAEHGLDRPTLGLILDGTGAGDDGRIWGGELLYGDAGGFRRLAHIDDVPLPGGDVAIRQPWRAAVSHLRAAFGDDLASWPALPWLSEVDAAPTLELLARSHRAPMTSSCGRLFDAVAVIAGGPREATYEAQPALELAGATSWPQVAAAAVYGDAIRASADGVIPIAPLIRAVARDAARGRSRAEISARFHRSLAELLVAAAGLAYRRTGCREVVLAGGVFQNDLLLRLVLGGLDESGLQALRPRQVPPGDGGIAVGQAVIAARQIADSS